MHAHVASLQVLQSTDRGDHIEVFDLSVGEEETAFGQCLLGEINLDSGLFQQVDKIPFAIDGIFDFSQGDEEAFREGIESFVENRSTSIRFRPAAVSIENRLEQTARDAADRALEKT